MDRGERNRARPTQVVVDLKVLRDPWIKWCLARGLTPSEGIRQALRRVVEGSPALDTLPHPADFGVNADGGKKRLEIRLTNAEHIALTAVADREGMSLPRWLTGLVRLHLTGEQQFGEEEVRALTRSSQVLLAIGRNVNQIARNMNQRADKDELTLAQIEYLVELIKHHTEAVSDLLTANSRRWRR